MKIRTDFVTNSSSSSFTVAVNFKMKDGNEIKESTSWNHEETDLIVKKGPLALADAQDVKELIKIFSDSIYVGPMYGSKKIRSSGMVNTIKDGLCDYSIDDIESVTYKIFNTDNLGACFSYDEMIPREYSDDFPYNSNFRIYKYDFDKNEAYYYDDRNDIEINGHPGGRVDFDAENKYREVPYTVFTTVHDEDTIQRENEFQIENGILTRYVINNEKTKIVNIPDEVHTIGKKAFVFCDSIVEVYMPDSVKEIEEDAFHCCSSLEKVRLSKELESLGPKAFSGCDLIKEIEIPHHLKKVTAYSFDSIEKFVCDKEGFIILDRVLLKYCGKAKKVTIPESVSKIGEYAFRESYISNIEIPANVKEIGAWAFSRCFYLKSVSIAGPLKAIEESTFRSCENLQKIDLPSTLQIIGKRSFMDCLRLKEIVLPNSLKTIDESAFENCKELLIVKNPSSIKTVGHRAFKRCENLTSADFLDNVSVIENSAFKDCPKIKSVKLPKDVIVSKTKAFDKEVEFL